MAEEGVVETVMGWRSEVWNYQSVVPSERDLCSHGHSSSKWERSCFQKTGLGCDSVGGAHVLHMGALCSNPGNAKDKMAQRLRAPAALLEDPGSIPSSQLSVPPIQGHLTSSDPLWYFMLMYG